MNLDSLLNTIQELARSNKELTYVILGISAFVENVFPPIPGDTITLFGAFLVGTKDLEFIGVFIATTIGSLAGFMAYYYLGYYLGRGFIEKKNWKLFSIEHIDKTNKWIVKYGYYIILANRFIYGVRSVISISAGIAKMNTKFVVLLAFISCVLWNGLLLYLGYIAGDNWENVVQYLKQYGQIVIGIIISIIILLIIRWLKRKKNSPTEESSPL